MTNSNSSSSTSSFERKGLQSSNGLLEIYKAVALIVNINEEHKHHIIPNIFEHLFHGKALVDPINHPDVLDFLSGLRMIMDDEHIDTLHKLDNHIHESKHKFSGNIFCNIGY